MTSPARRPTQAKPQAFDARPGALVTIAADLDPAVVDLIGGRLAVGPIGTLLGEARGPHAIAVALRRALAVEVVA